MENNEQKIIDIDIEQEVKKSFMEYAMSVIISRALPDVKDGLKPVQRRIIYTMYDTGLTPEKAYRKSVAAVGDVLGKYHPHGEASVYDAMVRMAQDFSLRYPLVDGHGNFGSIDGDPPAAYRYTEAKLGKLSLEMVRDIEKNTVDFMPNFDGRMKEPTVLPSRFPNLLVNGSTGIAVGMATNVPPHNLREVVDGALYIMDNPDASLEDIMRIIPGPDFPTGGIILGRSGIRSAYATGKGHIKVRACANIEEFDNGRSRIIVSEIPYEVNKARMCEEIGNLVKEKKIEGITALRDESNRNGIRVVIELNRSANANVILNQLYQYTNMQRTFAVSLLAIVDNTPKVLSLKEMLDCYLAHQKDVIVRRTEFDLKKALDRANILEGLRIAVDYIDEVVRIIRSSANIPEAKEALMERFKGFEVKQLLKRSDAGYDEQDEDLSVGLNEEQAQAIVSMTLGQLTGLGVDKIEKEYEEKMAIVRECRNILASDERISGIIKTELTEIRNKFGDERRTKIEAQDNEIDVEDLIKKETCVYTLTKLGYIKRLPVDVYRVQRRGGRGVSGMSMREEDVADTIFVGKTHDYMMFFTTHGRVFRLKGYQIPEAGRTAKGTNIVNLLEIEKDERVSSMLHLSSNDECKYIFMITKNGTVKRVALSEFANIRRAGLRALMLEEGDELISTLMTTGSDDIIIGTKNGRAACFAEESVRPMGRSAVGVIGIRLDEGDEVIGGDVLIPGSHVLTVTENGFGKLTEEDKFPRHNRGVRGVTMHDLTEKTGVLSGLLITERTGEIVLITSEGTLIRTDIDKVRVCGRISQGVRIMKTGEGEKVIGIASVPEEDSAEEENPNADMEEKGDEAEVLDNSETVEEEESEE
ncbi:MAG: DNA gyrase subunit A [Clostridiales bacterium]|nr:DNA gyrase subunit A [Clostridiales bacterium]